MRLSNKDFSDTAQMSFAIRDILRYQRAYIEANDVDGIMVKWKKGWFMIAHKLTGESFHSPTEFRNMTDVLEKRIKVLEGGNQ